MSNIRRPKKPRRVLSVRTGSVPDFLRRDPQVPKRCGICKGERLLEVSAVPPHPPELRFCEACGGADARATNARLDATDPRATPLTLTADEARVLVRVLDLAREWPAVGDIFSGDSQDPAVLRGNIAASKALLDTALAALPPALLARLRGAAGTGTEAPDA